MPPTQRHSPAELLTRCSTSFTVIFCMPSCLQPGAAFDAHILARWASRVRFRGLYWSKALSNQLLASLFHSAPALSRSSVVVIAFIQADFLQLAVI